ncbi:hypothetical protein EV189_3950 [Motilibacter rhizosphaerae]|uniref:DUF11 domain-containing protein n=2 Tax=Motilibacter rhizosphaerae TaxID=598652 RepID=A0A4Q7N7S0_9ACTN|nr:hypothetical protein EV189_3950 [Motilibacter rhizosphaerae]
MLAASLLLPLTLVAPHAEADTSEGTRLHEVALSAPTAPLTGAHVGHLSVSVHLSNPAGVRVGTALQQLEAGDEQPTSTCPCVRLVRSGPLEIASSDLQAPLQLSAGTPVDGTWTAQVPVTAAQAGTWHVETVGIVPEGDGGDNRFDPPPVPPVVVRGSDPVVLSLVPATRLPVKAGSPVVYRVVARTRDTHRPVPGLRIGVLAWEYCDPHPWGTFVRTGVDGTVRWAYPRSRPGSSVVLRRPLGGDESVVGTGRRGEQTCSPVAPYAGSVTARAARTSVRAGTDVAITGRAGWACRDARPQLQRKVGRAWRAVGRTQVHLQRGPEWLAGCTYRVLATPHAGTNVYRVRQPPTAYGSRAASTRAFHLTGR